MTSKSVLPSTLTVASIVGVSLAAAAAGWLLGRSYSSRYIKRYPFEESHRLHKCFGKAVVHRGIVRLSGQVGAGADVVAQTRDTLRKIDELLRMCGTDKSRLLSASVWLKNISQDFSAFNEIW